MPKAVTHGEFHKFLNKYKFIPTGSKKNRYTGVFKGRQKIVVFHYHKDKDTLPEGTFHAISRSLGCTAEELYQMIKNV